MFDVYITGDFLTIVGAYNGLAMLFGDSYNIYYGAAVFSLLGLLLSAITKVFDENQKPVHNFFFGLILFAALAGPLTRTSVLIENVRTGQTETVDNIPLLVALNGSVVTTLLTTITSDIQTAMSVMLPVSASGLADASGGLDPLRTLEKLNRNEFISGELCNFASSSSANKDICQNIQNFISECVARDIVTGGTKQETSPSIIANAKPSEFLTALKSTNTYWQTRQVSAVDKAGTYVPCATAYQQIATDVQSPAFADALENALSKSGIKSADLEDATALVTNGAGVAYDVALHRFLRAQTVKGLKDGLSKNSLTDVSIDNMQFSASEQRLAKMTASGSMFVELAPALITFFEMFAIFVAPFVLLLLVTGRYGFMAIGSYCLFTAYVNLWPVVAVASEMLIKGAWISNANGGMALTEGSLSWSGLPDTMDRIQNYLAVGSAIMAATPTLTMMLLTKNISSMAGASKAVAPDADTNSHYVAPNLNTAPDAGATRAGRNSGEYDSRANGGKGGMVSEINGSPMAEDISVANSLNSIRNSAIGTQKQTVKSLSNTLGQSIMHNLESAINAGNNTTTKDGQTFQDAKMAQAVLNGIKQYAAAHDLTESDAASEMLSKTKNQTLGWDIHGGVDATAKASTPGGGATGASATANVGAGASYSENTTDAQGHSRAKAVKSGSGVTETSAVASGRSNANSVQNARVLDLLTGHSLATSGGSKDAYSKTESLSQSYMAAQSRLEKLEASTSVSDMTDSKMSANTWKDIASKMNENPSGFDYKSFFSSLDSQSRESLQAAGIINSSGDLSNESQSWVDKRTENIDRSDGHLYSGGQISNMAAVDFMMTIGNKLAKTGDLGDMAAAGNVYGKLNEQAPSVLLSKLSDMSGKIAEADNSAAVERMAANNGVDTETINNKLNAGEGRINDGQEVVAGKVSGETKLAEQSIAQQPAKIKYATNNGKTDLIANGEDNDLAAKNPSRVAKQGGIQRNLEEEGLKPMAFKQQSENQQDNALLVLPGQTLDEQDAPKLKDKVATGLANAQSVINTGKTLEERNEQAEWWKKRQEGGVWESQYDPTTGRFVKPADMDMAISEGERLVKASTKSEVQTEKDNIDKK